MSEVVKPINGNTAKRTGEKLHPIVNAKVRPDTVIEKARMIVPIFSPSALCIALDSLLSLADNSLGLTVSNHELSYLKIASRYLVRVFLTVLSLLNSKKEYMTREVIQIAIPTQVKMRDI